jgi:uncharacterized metal-binding protein
MQVHAKCGGEGSGRLIYSCSGVADVGGLADAAARRLTKQGLARMHCLAGIGGQVPEVLEVTRQAQVILAIDGCPLDCAKRCLEREGFNAVQHLRLTDHGFVKGQTVLSDANLEQTMQLAMGLLDPQQAARQVNSTGLVWR